MNQQDDQNVIPEIRLSMTQLKRNRKNRTNIALENQRDLLPFDDEIHRVIPAKVFIRDHWRKPKESFMMYRKSMRNMAIATKRLVQYGSVHAYLIVNKRTLEVVTNVADPE